MSTRSIHLQNAEVTVFPDGTVDEIFVRNPSGSCILHLEQMSERHYWAAIYDFQNNKELHFDLSAGIEEGETELKLVIRPRSEEAETMSDDPEHPKETGVALVDIHLANIRALDKTLNDLGGLRQQTVSNLKTAFKMLSEDDRKKLSPQLLKTLSEEGAESFLLELDWENLGAKPLDIPTNIQHQIDEANAIEDQTTRDTLFWNKVSKLLVEQKLTENEATTEINLVKGELKSPSGIGEFFQPAQIADIIINRRKDRPNTYSS
jgi:hypothetical protein